MGAREARLHRLPQDIGQLGDLRGDVGARRPGAKRIWESFAVHRHVKCRQHKDADHSAFTNASLPPVLGHSVRPSAT